MRTDTQPTSVLPENDAEMLVPYNVTVVGDGNSGTHLVQLFSTNAESRLCMITLDAIHESSVEFCPDATLVGEFAQYNGIRLPCEHEFNAVCLIWFWMLNRMVCPCCRYQFHEDDRASFMNFAVPFRAIFYARKKFISNEEERAEMEQAETSVMPDIVHVSIMGNLHITVSPQIALYLYGRDGVVYSMVFPLYRTASRTNIDIVTFSMQRNDLRAISRYMDIAHTDRIRLVLFMYDGVESTVVTQSTPIYSESGRLLQHERDTTAERTASESLIQSGQQHTGDHPVAHVSPLLRPEGYNIVSSVATDNGVTFTQVVVPCRNGMGDMFFDMEENTSDGTLRRISQLQWICTQSEHDRVMRFMRL
jgi:hypothetical protein